MPSLRRGGRRASISGGPSPYLLSSAKVERVVLNALAKQMRVGLPDFSARAMLWERESCAFGD